MKTPRVSKPVVFIIAALFLLAVGSAAFSGGFYTFAWSLIILGGACLIEYNTDRTELDE